MISHPSGMSTAPLSLVSSANLLSVHLISLSVSLMKIFNSTCPSTDPWGTPLVTNLHLDIKPLTTTLWMQLSNQFLIHLTVHPSNPYLSNLERRVLWVTLLKGLQKSRWMTSIAFPLSTDVVAAEIQCLFCLVTTGFLYVKKPNKVT